MKNIRLALETLLIRAAVWLIPRLSRRMVLILSDIIGTLAYVFDYQGRPTAKQNLRAAFAPEGITEEQVSRIARASYRSFALTFHDLFWASNLTNENYTDYVRVHYADPETEALARDRGCLWLTPHFASFEMISIIMGFRDLRMTVVAQEFKNPALTDIFSQLRQVSGHHIIPQQGAMLRFIKELKRKGQAAMLTDLNVKPNKLAAVVDCFGLKTCATTLHTSVSHRLQIPTVNAVCISREDGTFDAYFARPMLPQDYATPQTMAQAVWDRFEVIIRQRPEAWLWMYKHWRYLPADTEGHHYPPYANPSRGFQQMLKEQPPRASDVAVEMKAKTEAARDAWPEIRAVG